MDIFCIYRFAWTRTVCETHTPYTDVRNMRRQVSPAPKSCLAGFLTVDSALCTLHLLCTHLRSSIGSPCHGPIESSLRTALNVCIYLSFLVRVNDHIRVLEIIHSKVFSVVERPLLRIFLSRTSTFRLRTQGLVRRTENRVLVSYLTVVPYEYGVLYLYSIYTLFISILLRKQVSDSARLRDSGGSTQLADNSQPSPDNIHDKTLPANNVSMALYASNLPALRKLAVPAVCVLIAFLAYSSQILFHHLEPGPLTRTETIWFNSLVACIWWSYERACRVDPGRLPRRLAEGDAQDAGEGVKKENAAAHGQAVGNWCRKCEAVKPPRAHHCRQCNR